MPEPVEFVAETLRAGGVWTVGVDGAIAEFDPAGAAAHVEVTGSTVTASTVGGALRISLGPEVRLVEVDNTFVLAAPPSPEPPRTVVTDCGADVDSPGGLRCHE